MKKQTVFPSHPHGAKITQIFDYGWKWIESPNEGNSPNWSTNSKYCIRPRTLWNRFQDAATIIGVRFGSSTSYGMIDIDADSPHNNPDSIADIKWALETIGITRTILIRSSWSNGLHIYCPLPQKFPSWGLACALQQCLEAQGYELKPGELEIFPNVKSYGKAWQGEFTEYNGHRLPLQPATGSLMVDEDLQPIPNGDSLAIFLARWENAAAALDVSDIAEAISVAKANRRRHRRKSNGKVEQWRQDLQGIIAEGWTGPGQTNQMLKEIACYGRVFEALEGKDLAEYIERTATNCPGFFDHSDHQHDLSRRAYHWAMSASHYYWPLGTLPLREKTSLSINDYRAATARERIAQAMNQIGETVGLGIRALAAKIVELTNCSLATLYRHKDLWHPFSPAPPPAPPDPPPASTQDRLPVTAQPEGLSADMERIRAIIRESLKSTENQPVTHLPPQDEVCNLKSASQKNLTSGGKEGGAGGGKVYPQPQPVDKPPGVGWLPRLDWQEGAVGDV